MLHSIRCLKVTCLCCCQGCSVTNSSGIWASRHYHRCPHAPPEVTEDSFQCVRCDAIFKNKSDIETHVKKHSWKSEVCAPDTDDSADSYVSDNDTSSSDPEFDSDASLSDNKVKQPARRKKKPSKPVDVCGYPTHQLASLTPQTLSRHIFPSAYPWTLAFHKSLQLTGVWPEWRPKVADWTLVDDVAPYLPVSELSPSFCVKQKKKVKVPTTRLPLFDAVLHGDATFNVGGPIWAATWCPVPVSETGRQYLAVYCHRHRDDTHIVEKCLDTSTALLQVWDCGTLQTG
ncbi:hypothetical protein NP493_1527g00040 [Ridgeia piscesae]|uniref:C2H2-type domain-containing protein n=1 Tax=Ridgeia piscesae TaxID=27915 RepID=A0AAD9K0U0_RIDPI|nr:hypothetical protein NP493_1527g00040 [Ridgeia piscesae]